MSKHEIFYTLTDLFYDGTVAVRIETARQVLEAARHALPEFTINAEPFELEDSIMILHVENFNEVK